ncbi:uridylate kinase [Hyphomicrobium sp. CS1BSMeth3]|uniref:uridylate kinase n=1 Tax=Hyphomicrobium sp. CS1BSMeth3 TaxID=1892844 RepID=UPI000A897216|nr:uridylate kinase [Hyphomicrobium sp. CS1BSMeth3]
MTMERAVVLERLAARLTGLSLGRPVRIAIDGRTASGKTTLADEIALHVRRNGYPVIRTSIDGFHRPKTQRYARGRYSAEGYYYDARDLAAVMKLLLAPLGPKGDRLYRTQSFDLENDVPVDQAPQLAPTNAILIVDGTFLQRPELREGWDIAVFVKTSERTSELRGVSRDADRLGGEDMVRQLYAERYRPAFDLYERICAPEKSADVLFVNEHLQLPEVYIRHDGRVADSA